MANSVKHNAIPSVYKNRAQRRNIEERHLECIFRFSILNLNIVNRDTQKKSRTTILLCHCAAYPLTDDKKNRPSSFCPEIGLKVY